MSDVTRRPAGIHHVTAVASDPQANADFYLSVLGLRMVKRTVNFDLPETYHLYYGDDAGRPGTILTFFPWPDAGPGRRGAGQATTVSFSVPEGSLGWWRDRLDRLGVETTGVRVGVAEEALGLYDPDGLALELVAQPQPDPRPPWEAGPVAAEHAIRGLGAVTLTEGGYEPTAELLTATLGFTLVGETGGRARFVTGDGGPGATVDVVGEPGAEPGLVAAGTVHHVAWRTPDETEQLGWRSDLVAAGLEVTPVIDRQYFRSIYFREPGGVLFEIATDPPGFTVDESPTELGRGLRLPPWLEPRRAEIEGKLPPLEVAGP